MKSTTLRVLSFLGGVAVISTVAALLLSGKPDLREQQKRRFLQSVNSARALFEKGQMVVNDIRIIHVAEDSPNRESGSVVPQLPSSKRATYEKQWTRTAM
jgi:hypothetical protein